MCNEVVSFLRTLIDGCHGDITETIISNVVQYWDTFGSKKGFSFKNEYLLFILALLTYSIKAHNTTQELFTNCWSLFCSILLTVTSTTSTVALNTIQQLLISQLDCNGKNLCVSLIDVYESIDNGSVKDVTLSSISLLVSVSTSAKDGAIEGNIMIVHNMY